MKRLLQLFPVLLLACVLAALPGCSSEPSGKPGKEAGAANGKEQPRKRFLAFGGGPTGGTFNFFANKIASIVSTADEGLDIAPRGSGGSAENLRSLNKNGVDMGIVYSGDAFLGREGRLPGDPAHYDKVRALGFLYGAPAQLVVRADSDIHAVRDLTGRSVAVGNPGSGAALAAERFLRHLGLWDKMKIRHLGYSQAAQDFADKRIDAFWVLVGYPNSAVIEAASMTPIRLLDLHAEAKASGFYGQYPFYVEVEIPGGSYAGQADPVDTFQDAALWCAGASLDEGVVYDSLKAIYAGAGIKALAQAHKAARDMSVKGGLRSVSIPLHPGAVRFWREQGLAVPATLLPQ
ncbi:TAXI family TRAP transporter solute-binding subunit [Pseudodesulfovibrio sp.]|uniref:TAXI family TRAP transporter solute-binding subunit n=1 Tax=Pseudodesulfovibrio sp. TaxID=2035812 RepID=UPI00261A1307|nr:TAXI family TRAP transporter solute-binding subunit [Pseudodesulfovibrio sp.]MDD3311909.1 TAXI family TRAP transporter solute-binding subunit [Pseudodesulfovibrio sp.]